MHIFGGDRYHTISSLKQTMWTQTNEENGRSAEGNGIGLLHLGEEFVTNSLPNHNNWVF